MASHPSIALFARVAPVTGAVLGVLLFSAAVGAAPGVHATGPSARVPRRAGRRRAGSLPDLTVVSLSRPPSSLALGSTFDERFRERNRGKGRAARSSTAFYLSPSTHLNSSAIQVGTAVVRALRGGRRSKGVAKLRAPGSTTPQSYWVIACANRPHRVKDRRARNDCRGSTTQVTVTSTPVTPAPPLPTNGPGCPATREPPLTSTDATCFAGDAEHGVFVSGLGDDHNPGTIAAPKRTLAAGTAAAAAEEADVYVTEGVFPETLDVPNGVSVFGGYDASWQRSPSHVTKITGEELAYAAAVAYGVKTPTIVQLVSLLPEKAKLPGSTSYGLRGAESPALVLDHVTVVAAPGTNGRAGSNGQAGAAGAEGHAGNGGGGGAGGTSTAAHPGGKGGPGGYDGENGYEGEAGQLTEPDSWGRMGGPGGPGGEGSSNPKVGGPGYGGDSGVSGQDGGGGGTGNALPPGGGAWLTQSGHSGTPGTSGHGGGGGGGGGSDSCTLGYKAQGGGGGGGGGGGQGGGGGGGGQGGGGSFGIFLEASNGAVVRDSTVSASDGGTGGTGGSGGYGGAGGAFGSGAAGIGGGGLCSAGAAAGGHGGLGGPGGLGGDGGGGAGGPSIAIFGLEAAAAPGTTVGHGQGGAGAQGNGGVGANGVAADFD